MEENKKQRSFKILIVLNFIFSIFYILSGDNVMGILFFILAVMVIILDLISDIVIMLNDIINYLTK